MSHTLDNDPVLIGDAVHDVVFGTGQVTELLAEGRFRVLFAGNKRFVYDNTGTRTDYQRKTLYWHDPIIMVPAKDDIGWNKMRDLAKAMVEVVRTWATA